MKHIKLFENWMNGVTETPIDQPAEETPNIPTAFADFMGEFPGEAEVESFGLKVASLPDGNPRVDEYGYTLIGQLEDLEDFSRQIGHPITVQGIGDGGFGMGANR